MSDIVLGTLYTLFHINLYKPAEVGTVIFIVQMRNLVHTKVQYFHKGHNWSMIVLKFASSDSLNHEHYAVRFPIYILIHDPDSWLSNLYFR